MDTPSKSRFPLITNLFLGVLLIGTAGAFPYVQSAMIEMFMELDLDVPAPTQMFLNLPAFIPLGMSCLLICLLVANEYAPVHNVMKWGIRGAVLLSILGFWMLVTLSFFLPLRRAVEMAE